MAKLQIIPTAELNGEGNGWSDCSEDQATMWNVEDRFEVVGTFYSRAEAEAYIAKVGG